MSKKQRNRWAGLIIGPVLAYFSLAALWKNETRFDYHNAAVGTWVIQSSTDATAGQLISLTGPMDTDLTISGEYVEAFIGFLYVQRDAEIYAWNRDEDDDGVDWDLRWMSGVESNSRNEGVMQQLASKRFLPPEFFVGELQVTTDLMEFVDDEQDVDLAGLTVNRADLEREDQYLYLRKNHANNLGDERIRYFGIPVPEMATYFGKFDSGKGVADTTHRRTGFLHEIIQDSGVLHHLVAGERTTALKTMKEHIGALKWAVRIIGTVFVVVGLWIFFSTIVGFLFHIPIVGFLAKWGTFLLSLAIGLPLSVITVLLAYLTANPLVLVALIVLSILIVVLLRRKATRSQLKLKGELEDRFGRTLDADEMRELEFIQLAQLMRSDSNSDQYEIKFLRKWSQKQGWDEAKFDEMIETAEQISGMPDGIESSEEHLRTLIHLSLADGRTSKFEIKAIRKAARSLGIGRSAVQKMMSQIQQASPH